MFDEEMMRSLELLLPNESNIDSIENVIRMRCDCTGGCTDNCYDCSKNSGNQW